MWIVILVVVVVIMVGRLVERGGVKASTEHRTQTEEGKKIVGGEE